MNGKSIIVLKYEPLLTHSIWCDFMSKCRTEKGIKKQLRDMTLSGEIVGYRIITVHERIIGITPPLTDREMRKRQK